MKPDIIIAGSGFAGSAVAYLAAKAGKRVLLYERRSHIAGNMYDEYDAGVLVQRYGPHTMHTSRKEVMALLLEIGEWEPYTLRARVMIRGKATPSPFNFKTIDDYWPAQEAERLKRHLQSAFPGEGKVPVLKLAQCGDPLVREYAQFLISEDYRPYTAKQWGIPPEQLDASVWDRVPVRLSYKDGYFDDAWECLPKGGYTEFFGKMLSSPLIEVRLGEDILEHLEVRPGAALWNGAPLSVPLVYTGALDELFGCRFGRLQYRSLRFEYETLEMESYQEAAGVAHPKAEGFTRITEYTKLPVQAGLGRTVIAREYPTGYGAGAEPYYPILTGETQRLAGQYRALAEAVPNLHLCGRLAEFRYYNMDEAICAAMGIARALGLAERTWKHGTSESHLFHDRL